MVFGKLLINLERGLSNPEADGGPEVKLLTENISLEEALDIYYNSKLANRIHEGKYGIQYLDYKVLVQILCETEPELLQRVHHP